MQTRISPLEVEFNQIRINEQEEGYLEELLANGNVAAIIVQYPNTEGMVQDNLDKLIQLAHKKNVGNGN